MQDLLDLFKSKRNALSLLILLVLAVMMPTLVNLAKQQQILKTRAAGTIEFTGDNIEVRNNQKVLKPIVDPSGNATYSVDLNISVPNFATP